MSVSQDRLVLAATAVSESAWLFSVGGVAAVVMGRGESPLSWFAILATLGLALVVARMSPAKVAAMEAVYLLRSLVGLGAIYVTVGTQVPSEAGGLDLAWVVRLVSGSADGDYAFRAVAGSFIGAALWWRGSRLALAEFPTDSLKLSFRVGLLGLALAAVVDINQPADLGTFPMIFIFFAAGLGGLSIGHLLPQSSQSAGAMTWHKVIAGVVSAIVLIGFAFGLLHRGLLSYFSTPAVSGLGAAVKGAFWAIVLPIAVVFNWFVELLIAIFDRPYEPGAGETGLRSQQLVEEAARAIEEAEEAGTSFYFVIQVVEWVFLGVIALFFLLLLARALRRFLSAGPKNTDGDRESVKEDANPVTDIAGLVRRLIPEWIKRRERKPSFRLPDGPPGVVAVLRVYYDLLTLAEDKGHLRRPAETAVEFQSTLERLFPRNLVRMATTAFNRACYGLHPATKEQIAQMSSSLASVRVAVRIVGGRAQGSGTYQPRD